MQLVLTLKGTHKPGHDGDGQFVIEKTPVIVGRGKKADWLLTDKTRFVSSSHFSIERENDGFALIDGSSNGTVVDGVQLSKGQRAALRDGSRIQLGLYRIDVTLKGADTHDDDRTVIGAPAHEETIVAGVPDDRTVISTTSSDRTEIAGVSDGMGIEPQQQHAAPVADTPSKPSSDISNAVPVTPEPAITAVSHGPADGTAIETLAEAMGLSPDHLAGRGTDELLREMGKVLARLIGGLSIQSRQMADARKMLDTPMRAYGRGDADEAVAFEKAGDQRALLAQLLEVAGQAEFAVSGEVEELAAHHEAYDAAMQEALYQLLNRLSPMQIESITPSGLTGKSAAAKWLAYNVLWEELAAEGENGLYDVFLRYFREAYEKRLTGL